MQNNEKNLSFPNNDSGLAVFNFENSPIRTLTDQNGEIHFVAVDVCKVLELEQVSNALKRLDLDEVISINLTDNLGRSQKTNIINESGLYSLVLSSRKPEAKAFKKWVTSEVLPQIRKTGAYNAKPLTQGELLLQNAQMLVNIERKQLEQDKAIASITQKQEEAEGYMDTLRKEPIRAMQINTRKAVDALVKNYAVAKGVPPSNSYNLIYKEFSLRYHRDVFNCAKRQKISCISWIEEQGYIAELYEVAKEVLIY